MEFEGVEAFSIWEWARVVVDRNIAKRRKAMTEKQQIIIAKNREDFLQYVRADPESRKNGMFLENQEQLVTLDPEATEVVILPGAEEHPFLTSARLQAFLSEQQRQEAGLTEAVPAPNMQQAQTLGGREAVVPVGTQLEETNVTHTLTPEQQEQRAQQQEEKLIEQQERERQEEEEAHRLQQEQLLQEATEPPQEEADQVARTAEEEQRGHFEQGASAGESVQNEPNKEK